MKLTLDILESGSTQGRKKNESQERFLNRIMQISIVGKSIQNIVFKSFEDNLKKDALNACVNLNVISLYENKIQKISGLENCLNLTRLYLQNNDIEEISGLNGLEKLSVL
jgi:protein phosphatase 1 regulatory subunit 42